MERRQIIVDAFLHTMAEHEGAWIDGGRHGPRPVELVHADGKFNLAQQGFSSEEIDEVLEAWFRRWGSSDDNTSES
jgi:hypothetical protein